MKPILIPQRYNYIAVFLSLECNLRCGYCINRFEKGHIEKRRLTGEDWVKGLNRIVSRDDLPLTLQGGEPSLHPDFHFILKKIRPELHLDLLTNLQFNCDEFMKNVHPDRLKRKAPYASIRVSYHPDVMKLEPLVEKVLQFRSRGYSIGIWGVMHPRQEKKILEAQAYAQGRGIDFRTKEFLGEYKGEIHGTMKYEGACGKSFKKKVMCRTTELIIGPDGGVYRCHSDLYEQRDPVANILDPEFQIDDAFRPCTMYGHCNPCDIKVKTNRFQIYGHTSVEIIFPDGN